MILHHLLFGNSAQPRRNGLLLGVIAIFARTGGIAENILAETIAVEFEAVGPGTLAMGRTLGRIARGIGVPVQPRCVDCSASLAELSHRIGAMDTFTPANAAPNTSVVADAILLQASAIN